MGYFAFFGFSATVPDIYFMALFLIRLGHYISMVTIFGYREFCILRTVGFNGWENATGEKGGTFKIHEKSKTHVSSMDKADNLVMVSHEKKLDISRFISKAYEEKVSRNRQIVLTIIDVVVILGAKKHSLWWKLG